MRHFIVLLAVATVVVAGVPESKLLSTLTGHNGGIKLEENSASVGPRDKRSFGHSWGGGCESCGNNDVSAQVYEYPESTQVVNDIQTVYEIKVPVTYTYTAVKPQRRVENVHHQAPVQQTWSAPVQQQTWSAPVQHQSWSAPVQHQSWSAPVQHQSWSAPVQHQTWSAPVQHQSWSAPVQTHSSWSSWSAPVQQQTWSAPSHQSWSSPKLNKVWINGEWCYI